MKQQRGHMSRAEGQLALVRDVKASAIPGFHLTPHLLAYYPCDYYHKVALGRFSPSTSVSPAIAVRSTNYSTITLMYHPGNAQ
jgi:hypothetical protein